MKVLNRVDLGLLGGPGPDRERAIRRVDDRSSAPKRIELSRMLLQVLVRPTELAARQHPVAAEVRPAIERTRRLQRCRYFEGAGVEFGRGVVRAS